jgi:hypothetical protein
MFRILRKFLGKSLKISMLYKQSLFTIMKKTYTLLLVLVCQLSFADYPAPPPVVWNSEIDVVSQNIHLHLHEGDEH